MKKVIRLLLLFGLFCLLNQPIQAMAASARLICVNGKPGEDNIYFYSADFFYSGIKGYYINGLKINGYAFLNNPDIVTFVSTVNNIIPKAKSNDITIFYYSGHSTTDSSGNKALHIGMGYSFEKLYQLLSKIPGKKLIVLDCCGSGELIQFAIRDKSFDRKNTCILCACKADQYTPYYDKLRILRYFGKNVHVTRFSDSIYNGLGIGNKKMEADSANGDNTVNVPELFAYLRTCADKTFTYTDAKTGKSYKLIATPVKYGAGNFRFTKADPKDTVIKLNKTKASVNVNGTISLTATVNGKKKTVKWISSNKSIATVSSKGKVTGKKEGTTTITATINGAKATCKVTVIIPVKKIKLNKTSVSITKGKTLTLTATVSPTSATKKTIKWTSSNPKVATVTSKGVVKGVSAGTATITAKATDGSGTKATSKITVKKASSVNSITDFSKVFNLLPANAAKTLALTKIKNTQYITYCNRAGTTYGDGSTYLWYYKEVADVRGAWSIIVTDKHYSLYGLKIGTYINTIHSAGLRPQPKMKMEPTSALTCYNAHGNNNR